MKTLPQKIPKIIALFLCLAQVVVFFPQQAIANSFGRVSCSTDNLAVPIRSEFSVEKVAEILTQEMIQILLKDPSITISDLAKEIQVSPKTELFKRALHHLFQKLPKTILHEHTSGLFYAEDLLAYYLDEEIVLKSVSPEEAEVRQLARKEARRRFALTVLSDRKALDLQYNPLNPDNISQKKADQIFRQTLGIPKDTPLLKDSIHYQETANRLKKYVTYTKEELDWDSFEMAFTFIKTVRLSHPKFQLELLKAGLLTQHREDTLRAIELTDYSSKSFPELIDTLKDVEAETKGKLRITILKAFRKDYLERLLENAKNPSVYDEIIFPFKGLDYEGVKYKILKETLQSDTKKYGLSQDKIILEFQDGLRTIIEQVENKTNPLSEKYPRKVSIRDHLIFAYTARKQAAKDIDEFIAFYSKLNPVDQNRITGISSIGTEVDYINWVGSPIHHAAKAAHLKRSSHMGELWRKGNYFEALQRVKSEINIGVERLAHLTILGIDFMDKNLVVNLSDEERERAQNFQEEILRLIRKNHIHVETNPTSNYLISPYLDGFENHLTKRLFAEKIDFSINPDDSSIFDTSPSLELTKIALANSQLPFNKFVQVIPSSRKNSFRHGPFFDSAIRPSNRSAFIGNFLIASLTLGTMLLPFLIVKLVGNGSAALVTVVTLYFIGMKYNVFGKLFNKFYFMSRGNLDLHAIARAARTEEEINEGIFLIQSQFSEPDVEFDTLLKSLRFLQKKRNHSVDMERIFKDAQTEVRDNPSQKPELQLFFLTAS